MNAKLTKLISIWLTMGLSVLCSCETSMGQEETLAEAPPIRTLRDIRKQSFEMQGPFQGEFVPRSAPPLLANDNPPPVPGGRRFRVQVDVNEPLRHIPFAMYGNNGAVWLGDDFLLHETMKERLKTVQLPLLRWPGGSTSDHYHFDGVVPPYGEAKNWPKIHDHDWAPDTIEFGRLVKELNAIPMIVVNHGLTSYGYTPTSGRLEDAVELAAGWVEYCNAPNDGSNPRGGKDWAAMRAADGHPEPIGVKYWEVGNEVFGAWEIGHTDGATYATNFVAFTEAMKEVDPTIYVGATGVVNFDRPGMTLWMAEFLRNEKAVAAMDFLDIHDYFAWLSSNDALPSEDEIRQYYKQIGEDKEELDRLFAKYAHTEPVPYFFGEYHLTHPQNVLNVSLASGLVAATSLGEFIINGFDAAALWDLGNEWKNGGDLGFLSRSHPTVPDYAPHPPYYAYYMYTRNFGDTLVASYPDDWSVHVYASTFAGGETGLVIVNPHHEERTAVVDFGEITIDGYVNAWVLSGETFLGTDFSFNGISTVHGVAGVPILDKHAYFFDVGQTHTFEISVAPYSVTNLLVY